MRIPRSALAFVAFSLLMVACTPAQQPPTDDQQSSSTSSAATSMDSSRTMDDSAAENDVSSSGEEISDNTNDEGSIVNARTIRIEAKNWAFSPANITVKQGEKINIEFAAMEGTHGFAVADLGINLTLQPGETGTVEIPTDAKGMYKFFCSVPCGPGHKEMQGTLVIE